MEKTNPYYTASSAALSYFVIFLILKYFLHNKEIDWKGAIIGALIFWVVIFIVHIFLNRKSNDLE